jgi:hypothetical protein
MRPKSNKFYEKISDIISGKRSGRGEFVPAFLGQVVYAAFFFLDHRHLDFTSALVSGQRRSGGRGGEEIEGYDRKQG